MNYKSLIRLLPIPILLLIVCAIYLLFLIQTNQIALDIDFKGGTQIFATSDKQLSDTALENVLKQYDASVRTSRGITGYAVFIDFDASIKSQDVLKALSQNGYNFKQYSIQTTGPAIGTYFFQQALIVLAFSFIFMAVTVFIMFRNPMPSLYLILTVASDLTETFVITQIIGIKLSLAVFAALLLLIGAAVGDNIMFTTRLLKSTQKDYDAIIKKTFKTGMTMFAAVQVAFASLLLISASAVITQIAAISIIGGVLDVMNSWVLNLGLLMLYMTRKIK
jgi:preprotein translocase subunit SecF